MNELLEQANMRKKLVKAGITLVPRFKTRVPVAGSIPDWHELKYELGLSSDAFKTAADSEKLEIIRPAPQRHMVIDFGDAHVIMKTFLLGQHKGKPIRTPLPRKFSISIVPKTETRELSVHTRNSIVRFLERFVAVQAPLAAAKQ